MTAKDPVYALANQLMQIHDLALWGPHRTGGPLNIQNALLVGAWRAVAKYVIENFEEKARFDV